MSSVPTTNPAGRLHSLLKNAKAAGVDNGLTTWIRVFPVTENDVGKRQIEVIRYLMQIERLIDETTDSLDAIPELQDRHSGPLARIRIVINQSFAHLLSDIRPQLNGVTDGDMTILEFCSDALEARGSEPIIDEEELKAVLQDVNTLFDEVKAGELDADLKSFILDGLESIRRAIHEFRIRGPERIHEAIANILADYMMNQRTPQTPKEKASLEKFNDAFARFVSLVTLGYHIRKLITVVAGPLLIGPGESPPDASSH